MAANSYAQKDTSGINLPFKDNDIVYEGVVHVPEMSKDDLYKNGKQWFIDSFKNSKNVIQNEDKEEGKIIGKGSIPVYYNSMTGTNTCRDMITIQIECKDNRYRYKIYDMALNSDVIGDFMPSELICNILGEKTGNRKMYTKRISRVILASIKEQSELMISSLKKSMKYKQESF